MPAMLAMCAWYYIFCTQVHAASCFLKVYIGNVTICPHVPLASCTFHDISVFFIIFHRFIIQPQRKFIPAPWNFMVCHSSCVLSQVMQKTSCLWMAMVILKSASKTLMMAGLCLEWLHSFRSRLLRRCGQAMLKIFTNFAIIKIYVQSIMIPSIGYFINVFIVYQFSQTCVDRASFRIEWPSHMQDWLCKMKDHRFPLHKSLIKTQYLCF